MRCVGVAHNGQGALVWVDCTARVICVVVSSISQASRCSRAASGNKRVKTLGVCLVMKAGASSRQRCLRAMSMNTCWRTTPPHQIFQSVISPKAAMNLLIVEDHRDVEG